MVALVTHAGTVISKVRPSSVSVAMASPCQAQVQVANVKAALPLTVVWSTCQIKMETSSAGLAIPQITISCSTTVILKITAASPVTSQQVMLTWPAALAKHVLLSTAAQSTRDTQTLARDVPQESFLPKAMAQNLA